MDWSISEVREVVADYFAMIAKELRGESYSKTAHRRALLPKLNNRNASAVEYKHQNISTVLMELGLPFIDGYKPARHYQELLREVVVEFVDQGYSHFRESLEREIPPVPPKLPRKVEDIVVPVPSASLEKRISQPSPTLAPRLYDFSAREEYNHRLGKLGEQFVVNFERARLIQYNRPDLAEIIDWVAQSRGDGLGYDILSFEIDGSKRLIEVKTTRYGRSFPFLITSNEVRFSETHTNDYYLYRLFRFLDSPGLWFLKGSVSQTCYLIPKILEAMPKG